jgi:DNA repair protein RadD
MRYQLRDYQITGVEKIRASFAAGNRAVCYQLPTGGGKSICFSYITESAYKKGNSILILVHRDNLLDQASKKLDDIGIRHGLIAAGYPQIRYRVQVASVQTLVRRLDQWDHFDLIIIDECHHSPSQTWHKIINHFSQARILGVTATPIRLDGKGLGNYFDDLILGPTPLQLMAQGYLSVPLIYAPTEFDDSGISKVGGDYNRKTIFDRMNNNFLTGCAVKHYTRLCPGEPAIAFCVSIEHAESVRDQFKSAGYASEALHSKMPDSLRKQYIADLASGKINVLTSCDIVSEGTDIPVLRTSILLRPTMSLGLFLQQVGRALRPYPGKPNAIILDHAGNCLRHGLPTDDIPWILTKDKMKFEKEIKIRRCPICFTVHEPLPACPSCGYVYVVKRKKASEPEQREGELQLITKDEVKEELEKASALSDFHSIAKKAGYKPGWAWIKWRERQACVET